MKLDEALKHLHAHTRLEAKLGVDSDHVIIDKNVFFALLEARNNPLSPVNSPGLYSQQLGRAVREESNREDFIKGFEEAVVVVKCQGYHNDADGYPAINRDSVLARLDVKLKEFKRGE